MSTSESPNESDHTPKDTSVALTRRTENEGTNEKEATEKSGDEAKDEETNAKPSLFQRFMHKHFPDAKAHDRWTLVFTSVIAVSTFLYMVAALWTLIELSKSTTATQIAAKAAKDSADLQRTIVEGTQAAEVMPAELNLDDRNFLRVSVMNVGGVASAKSTVDVEVSRQHLPDKRPLGTTQVFHFTADSLRARQPSGAHVFEILGYTQKDKWNIYHKRQAIIINTTIEFENGFGKWVQRKSCNEYLSIYGPKDNPQNPQMVGCEGVAMMLEQVLPPEQRAWKWQQ
jgi:hypothetical protein